MTINSDHSQLAKFEGEFAKNSVTVQNKSDKPVDKPEQGIIEVDDNTVECENESPVQEGDATTVDGGSGTLDIENTRNENKDNKEKIINNENVIVGCDVKKNEVVRFQKTPDGEWVQGRVLSRAGKKGRTYDKWWNIQNTVTGHIEPQDFGNMHGFEKVIPGENTETIESETMYMTSIPR